MPNHVIVGTSLIVGASIAFIAVMAMFQVPATQELALYMGTSVSTPVAWMANTGIAVALVAWMRRREKARRD